MTANAVQPARFVTIALAEALTGYTKDAIQTKKSQTPVRIP